MKKGTVLKGVLLMLSLTLFSSPGFAQSFNGLGSDMGNLFRLSDAKTAHPIFLGGNFINFLGISIATITGLYRLGS